MTRLGRGDPFHRAAAMLEGLFSQAPPPVAPGRPCRVIGHRGAARHEAENTIASFRLALELGADTVEADLSCTADGRFAVWHDADPNERVALARQLGAERLAYCPHVPPVGSEWRRPVRELLGDELERHYGYEPRAPGKGKRVGIAWLEDLEDWVAETGVADVYLDIKLAGDQTEAAAALVRRLERRGDGATLHLLSPQKEIVRALADACRSSGARHLRVSADLELPAPPARALAGCGAPDVSLGAGERSWPGYRHDVGRMLRARDEGVFGAVVAWTHNERQRLETLAAAGVDGVLTDEPALLREIVSALRPAEAQTPRARRV